VVWIIHVASTCRELAKSELRQFRDRAPMWLFAFKMAGTATNLPEGILEAFSLLAAVSERPVVRRAT